MYLHKIYGEYKFKSKFISDNLKVFLLNWIKIDQDRDFGKSCFFDIFQIDFFCNTFTIHSKSKGPMEKEKAFCVYFTQS